MLKEGWSLSFHPFARIYFILYADNKVSKMIHKVHTNKEMSSNIDKMRVASLKRTTMFFTKLSSRKYLNSCTKTPCTLVVEASFQFPQQGRLKQSHWLTCASLNVGITKNEPTCCYKTSSTKLKKKEMWGS